MPVRVLPVEQNLPRAKKESPASQNGVHESVKEANVEAMVGPGHAQAAVGGAVGENHAGVGGPLIGLNREGFLGLGPLNREVFRARALE